MNKQKEEIISCKAAARLMSLSCERKLTLREQIALKAHLAVCQTCRNCRRQIQALQKILPRYLKAVVTFDPPPESTLPAEFQKRLIRKIKSQTD